MFNVDASEFLLVAFVALIVIGPKDLPKAMRVVGYWVGKARGVARQFRSGFDSMVREAELEEMEKRWAAENERIMREHPPTDRATSTDPATSTDMETDQPHDGVLSDRSSSQNVPSEDRSAEPVMVERPVVAPAKPMDSLDLFDETGRSDPSVSGQPAPGSKGDASARSSAPPADIAPS